MVSVSRILDACIFVGALSAIVATMMAWVARDPRAARADRPSSSSWFLVVPLSSLVISGILGASTCLLSGIMSGHGTCRLQFKRGPPLDPVSSFMSIQVFYGVMLLVFLSFGALLAVSVYRKHRARR